MPKLSVVLSVYNGEQFLAQTLDSILGQSFNDFELIAIDDGSSDRTFEILSAYHKTDHRLVLVKNNGNIGIPKSRNHGCNLARGEYIAVSDADDISVQNRFERQVQFLEQYSDIMLVGSSAELINDAGDQIGRVNLPTSPGYLGWLLILRNPFVHSSIMMRRAAGAAVGFYSENTPVALDYDLVTRVSMVFKVANLPEALIQYRVSNASITSTSKPLQDQIATEVMQRLASHYLQRHVSLREITALRKLIWEEPHFETDEMGVAAHVLKRLFNAYIAVKAPSVDDTRAIARYTAARLFTVSRRLWPTSVANAVYWLLQGILISPFSVATSVRNISKKSVRAIVPYRNSMV